MPYIRSTAGEDKWKIRMKVWRRLQVYHLKKASWVGSGFLHRCWSKPRGDRKYFPTAKVEKLILGILRCLRERVHHKYPLLEYQHPGRVIGLRFKPELPTFFLCFKFVLILHEMDTSSLVFKAWAFYDYFPSSSVVFFLLFFFFMLLLLPKVTNRWERGQCGSSRSSDREEENHLSPSPTPPLTLSVLPAFPGHFP